MEFHATSIVGLGTLALAALITGELGDSRVSYNKTRTPSIQFTKILRAFVVGLGGPQVSALWSTRDPRSFLKSGNGLRSLLPPDPGDPDRDAGAGMTTPRHLSVRERAARSLPEKWRASSAGASRATSLRGSSMAASLGATRSPTPRHPISDLRVDRGCSPPCWGRTRQISRRR
jgi:hypothetical protein